MWTHAIDYNTNNDVYYEHFDYITALNNNNSNDLSLNAFSSNNTVTIDLQTKINETFKKISEMSTKISKVHDQQGKNIEIIDDLLSENEVFSKESSVILMEISTSTKEQSLSMNELFNASKELSLLSNSLDALVAMFKIE